MAIMERNELTELVEELRVYRGRQTELITVYIPSGYDVNSVTRQLEAEKSTAKNIKSNSTRKNVTEALEKIVRELKDIKKTPENGIAIFCGNIASTEGATDLRLWNIEPIEQVRVRLYRCDKEFVLEPLENMLAIDELYGLMVMDRKEATIGMLIGKRIDTITKMTSGIPGKVRAGGQSSQRFHRITEGLTRDFYKRIATEAAAAFFQNSKIKGILIGGPIPTKDEFIDGKYLMTPLQDLIIGVKDQGNTDESGLKDLVQLSQDVLAQQEIIHEQKILEKFFNTLGENPDMARYKIEGVEKALQYGAVDMLLISEEYDKVKGKELRKIADNISATTEMISTETPEGEQFLNLGGIGAILRFKV